MTNLAPKRGRGRPPYPGTFTPAEQRVLEGLKRGQTYQQIADSLGVSYDTVKYHVSNMLAKAEVESREELVEFAGKPGLRWAALPLWAAGIGGAAAVAAFALFAVLVLLNRGDGDEPAASETPTPSATATPEPSPTATAPLSGVPIVDAFIAAALSGDLRNIEPLIEYQQVVCTTEPQQGIGSPPPCPPGVPDGGTVPGIPAGGGCHGGVILESGMAAFLVDWKPGFSRAYSASDLTGTGSDVVPPVWYTVVMEFTQFADGSPVRDPKPGIEFWLNRDGVIAWSGWCGQTARGLAARHTSYLIEPPAPPDAPADTPHIGVPAVDEVIDAVVVRDVLLLQERTRTVEVGCGEERWIPHCGEGKVPGTLVPAVVREDCTERTWAPPFDLAHDYDSRLLDNPRIVAVAKGDGADGVGYWVIWNDIQHGAVGVTPGGEIAVIHGGCSNVEQLLAKFDEYVVGPR